MSVRLSELPSLATAPLATTILPMVEGGVTKKSTAQNLFNGIGNLSAASSVALTDTIPAVQSGTVKTATVQKLFDGAGNLAALGAAPAVASKIPIIQSGTAKSVSVTNLFANVTVTVPICLSTYTPRNVRALDIQLHGGIHKEADAQTLNSGSPINNVPHGIGKLILMPLAGSDPNGTVTITGDTIDRNTGVVTPGDTINLTLSGLSTDASTTDAEGNIKYSFSDGYITPKWLTGAYSVSTTDVNLSDLDIYHVNFEQVNDQSNITMQTFDISVYCNNTAGWFYAYLYTIEVTAPKVDLTLQSALSIPVGESAASEWYRLRRGNLGIALDGSTDGIFIDMFAGPDPQTYWEDINTKVWFDVVRSISVS